MDDILRERIRNSRYLDRDTTKVTYNLQEVITRRNLAEVAAEAAHEFFENDVRNWIGFDGYRVNFHPAYGGRIILGDSGAVYLGKFEDAFWKSVAGEITESDMGTTVNNMLKDSVPGFSKGYNPLGYLSIKRSFRKRMVAAITLKIRGNVEISTG